VNLGLFTQTGVLATNQIKMKLSVYSKTFYDDNDVFPKRLVGFSSIGTTLSTNGFINFTNSMVSS
jgi:hypothetical protein